MHATCKDKELIKNFEGLPKKIHPRSQHGTRNSGNKINRKNCVGGKPFKETDSCEAKIDKPTTANNRFGYTKGQ